jgi:hypothetical protein
MIRETKGLYFAQNSEIAALICYQLAQIARSTVAR